MEQSRIWNFIKYLALAVIAVLTVVLFAQFIQLAKLKNENQNLNNELNNSTQNYNSLQQKQDDLNENYTSFATDQAKEEYNMKGNGEEVIVSNE